MLTRLAKDTASTSSGRCPALYATDDPARMIAQVRQDLTNMERDQILELADDETYGSIPTETVLRAVAKFATEHGDDALAAGLEAFLDARGM